MANCHNCERLAICPWASPEEIICSSFKPKPITNADRLRQMTDEELANALAHKADACWNCSSDSLDICKDCWLDWLKQEVVT